MKRFPHHNTQSHRRSLPTSTLPPPSQWEDVSNTSGDSGNREELSRGWWAC